MNPIAILPLDDRPVNYDYPEILARSAGLELLRPPREWLGNPWRESQHTSLVEWLRQVSSRVDAILVAVDTLAYGGLIRMRTSHEPYEEVRARLDLLGEIKHSYPQITLLASSVIQRICRANSNEEEVPYWGIYGARMFRLSTLEHKIKLGEGSNSEVQERDFLKSQIPGEILDDYLGIRSRNHAVNNLALDWVENGILDYLILPQDDTADYGWNIAEARRLQATIRARRLTEYAITYPGADEIGCLLLARWVCQNEGFQPRIHLSFSSSSSATVITDYEDRPLTDLVKAHLSPLNGIVVDSADEADLTLFINAPALKQGAGELQWLVREGIDDLRSRLPVSFQTCADELEKDPFYGSTRKEMETPLRSPEEFIRKILAIVQSGKLAAVADVAYVNGCDLILGEQLTSHPEIARLAAFGGWNTAGNTLGTVLAQAVIRIITLRRSPSPSQNAAHLEFLFLRFLDDFAYQALVRTQCMWEDLPLLGIAPTEERLPDGEAVAGSVQACISKRLIKQSDELEKQFIASGMVKSIAVSGIYLPWQRLFEIGCQLKVTLA